MACNTQCVPPTTSQAHCGKCHQTFSGISAFDAHHPGRCDHPEAVGLRPSQEARGVVWRYPSTDRAWPSAPTTEPQGAQEGETHTGVGLDSGGGNEGPIPEG